MSKTEKNTGQIIDPETMNKALSALYDKVLVGIPKVSDPVDQICEDYLSKNDNNVEKAANSMIKYQLAKCTATGFLTSFGGFITMPVTIPTDLASVLYVQLRMVAAIAKMSGYDLASDQTRTIVYATLAGVSVNSIFKKAGVTIGSKITKNLINKIPGKVLTKINRKFGFRLITKAGSKGVINLTKFVPVVGGLVGGAVDFAETKIVADRACKLFIKETDFAGDKGVVDIDDIQDDTSTTMDAEVINSSEE